MKRQKKTISKRLGISEDEIEKYRTIGCLAKDLEIEENDSEDEGIEAVSYTHLTLPTIYAV